MWLVLAGCCCPKCFRALDDTGLDIKDASENPLQNIESEGIQWLKSKAESEGDTARLAKIVLQELG